jgi:hypothetical protein
MGKARRKKDRSDPNRRNIGKIGKARRYRGFSTKKIQLRQLMKQVQMFRDKKVVPLTIAAKRNACLELGKTFYPSLSDESKYSEHFSDMAYFLSPSHMKTGTNSDNEILNYLWFLDVGDVRAVIDIDMDCETTLKNKNHPWLKNSTPDFINKLPSMVRIIRQLGTGGYRLATMIDEIVTRCKTMYAKLKAKHREPYTNMCMMSWDDVEHLLYYDYTAERLNETMSDELVLEIAEVMYWFRQQCQLHPLFDSHRLPEMNEDIIYIGILYLLQTGFGNYLPKVPQLSERWYLVPKNKVGKFLNEESDARSYISVGRKLCKMILSNESKILPNGAVSFNLWKKDHSELGNVYNYSKRHV